MMLDTTTLRAAFGVIALTLLVLFYLVTFRHTRSEYSAWWCTALGSFSDPALFFWTEPPSRCGRTRWETHCWSPAPPASGPSSPLVVHGESGQQLGRARAGAASAR